MNSTFSKIVLVCASALLLNACASSATVSGMINTEYSGTKPSSQKMQNTVQLGDVYGGNETNPMWTSQISGNDFKEALRESLKNAGFAASGENTRYVLKANLMRIDQPLFGLDMTVTTTVKYILVDKVKNTVVWTQDVSAAHTATFSDAAMGMVRLRLANEGSAKKNIGQLLGILQGLDPDKISVGLN
ncbi:MAG: hypothetical protein JSU04_16785 [Bdellovibrionales bacterium]|nr:hypothetical protein [Bdellovibrionales bacterium]